MANFPANPKPDYPIQEQGRAYEVLISSHRDGSEQRRKKGNGKLPSYALTFTAISKTERDAFLLHYNGENGMTSSFTWVHPEWGSNHTVRYAKPWQFTLVALDTYDAAVELQEVPA